MVGIVLTSAHRFSQDVKRTTDTSVNGRLIIVKVQPDEAPKPLRIIGVFHNRLLDNAASFLHRLLEQLGHELPSDTELQVCW
jgi:hypothetical protein